MKKELEIYRKVVISWSTETNLKRLKFVIDFLKPKQAKLLELASFKRQMQQFLPDDIEYYSLGLEKINNKNHKYFDLNEKKLPYKNKQFDFIVATGIFEHVFDPKRLLKEIHRILKDNGKVILSFENILGIKKFYNLLRTEESVGEIGIQYYGTHHWEFTLNNARKFIKTYFKIIEERGAIGGFFPWLIRCPLKVSSELFFKCSKK